jgi:hypothetical protein
VRWHYRDPLLVWLFIPAYAAHILEEWIGGFPEWLAVITGSPLPRPAFIVINALALLVMIVAGYAATRTESRGWMAVAIATATFLNGTLHILGSLATGSYSPGLFTGFVLYLPLSQLTLMRAWSQAVNGLFGLGVLAGLAFHATVMLVAFTIARAN